MAGRLLLSYHGKLKSSQIQSKSSPVDLVSVADKEAEGIIRHKLAEQLPSAGFLGEESSSKGFEECELKWVVDPLDGTSNYLSGLPIWAVSIALCRQDMTPLVGVVHAPMLNKTWKALLGGGAWADGWRLSVRLDPPGGGLDNAMLATGFPYEKKDTGDRANVGNFNRMQKRFHKIRRLGSAAVDLAYVAEGTFDGFWELELSSWDTAAGILLISEAGGICQRIDGSPYTPGDYDLVTASTPELLKDIQTVLNSAGDG